MQSEPGFYDDLDLYVTEAIREGEPDRCLESMGSSGTPLIVAAAINGRLDLADALFDAGASMTANDLQQVVWWWGEGGTVAFLLDHGVPQNPACMYAALRHGRWEAVLALIDHGGDRETVVYPGETTFMPLPCGGTLSILHAAVWDGQVSVVQGLLQRGADVDRCNATGVTPLMTACHVRKADRRQRNPLIAYWLLKYGADPNAVSPEGKTALICCLEEQVEHFTIRTSIAQMLLRAGADPNVVTSAGHTPLMFAVRDNDTSLLRALQRAGARR